MHNETQLVALEINPVIPQPEAVERLAGPLQPPEAFQVGAHHFVRQTAKLAEYV